MQLYGGKTFQAANSPISEAGTKLDFSRNSKKGSATRMESVGGGILEGKISEVASNQVIKS